MPGQPKHCVHSWQPTLLPGYERCARCKITRPAHRHDWRELFPGAQCWKCAECEQVSYEQPDAQK